MIDAKNIFVSRQMYVCIGFYGAYEYLVLCARSQDSLLSASVRRVLVVFSTLLDLRSEENRGAAERHPESLAHLAGIEPKALTHHLSLSRDR